MWTRLLGRDPAGDAQVVEAVPALGDGELVVDHEGLEANGALDGHDGGESARQLIRINQMCVNNAIASTSVAIFKD